MITRRHMIHVKNRLQAMKTKLITGLPSHNSQCVEGVFDEVKALLNYTQRKLEEE